MVAIHCLNSALLCSAIVRVRRLVGIANDYFGVTSIGAGRTVPVCTRHQCARRGATSRAAAQGALPPLQTMRRCTTSHVQHCSCNASIGCSAMSALALHACVGTHAHSPRTHSPRGACHGCFRRRCRACPVRPRLQRRAALSPPMLIGRLAGVPLLCQLAAARRKLCRTGATRRQPARRRIV